MQNVIPLRPMTPAAWGLTPERTRVLSPREVAELTGMSYENALALMKVKGIKLGGRRWYITPAKLAEALEGARDE